MTKPLFFLSLLLLARTGVAAESGTYIEQAVITEAISGQPAMQGIQKTWFTSTHIRNEISFGKQSSAAIIDLQTKRIFLMPSEEKQYIEMRLSDYQRIVAMRIGGSGLNDPKANPRLTKTEEHKKIGQWPCTKYVFEQVGKVSVKSELWVTKETGIDFGFYLQLMKQLGTDKMLGRVSEYVGKIDGYPVEVKTEQSMDGQTVISIHRVEKIAQGPVDPSLFEVPAGYRRIKDEVLEGELSEKGDP